MKLLFSVIAILGITQGTAFSNTRPSYVAIDSIQINGSGCSNEYVGWDQWSNTVQVRTPDYAIQTNPNSRIERKNCQATIDVLKPYGWTYRVASVEVTGWAQVSGNIEAEVSNYHYIQGESRTDAKSMEIRSWYRDNYKLFNDTKGAWTPCGIDRVLNVNTAIMLRRTENAYGYGYLKVNPNVRVRLDWKRC
ncbi:MAG: DUF4360 domain-containing protein [Oligoflexus sp.]